MHEGQCICTERRKVFTRLWKDSFRVMYRGDGKHVNLGNNVPRGSKKPLRGVDAVNTVKTAKNFA